MNVSALRYTYIHTPVDTVSSGALLLKLLPTTQQKPGENWELEE